MVVVYFNFSFFEQDVSGAVQVITAKDIPQNGKNDFISPLAGDPELVRNAALTIIFICS